MQPRGPVMPLPRHAQILRERRGQACQRPVTQFCLVRLFTDQPAPRSCIPPPDDPPPLIAHRLRRPVRRHMEVIHHGPERLARKLQVLLPSQFAQ